MKEEEPVRSGLCVDGSSETLEPYILLFRLSGRVDQMLDASA